MTPDKPSKGTGEETPEETRERFEAELRGKFGQEWLVANKALPRC